MLDTNIFIYYATDKGLLSEDVYEAISEPGALLYVSAETVRELIVGNYNKSFDTRMWKTAKEMVKAIKNNYHIDILPIQEEQMLTYSM